MIVPGHESTGLGEHASAPVVIISSRQRYRTRRPLGFCKPAILARATQLVDDAVVEQQERGVEPGDHQVLVVARVGDDRSPRGVTRQVLELAAVLYSEFRAVLRVVQL